jgi:ribonuclease J
MMINLTRPYYIAPVHGEPRHQHLYNRIAADMGYPEHRIFTLEGGVPLDITEQNAGYGAPVTAGRVLVDNSGTPGVSDDVLKDRYNVANDGLVVVTIALDLTHGKLLGKPILQARGVHGPDGVTDLALEVLIDVLNHLSPDELRDPFRVKSDAVDTVRRFLQKRFGLRPMVLPILVEA